LPQDVPLTEGLGVRRQVLHDRTKAAKWLAIRTPTETRKPMPAADHAERKVPPDALCLATCGRRRRKEKTHQMAT
jgi:hypothetical protein